jgi:hypothetical protein
MKEKGEVEGVKRVQGMMEERGEEGNLQKFCALTSLSPLLCDALSLRLFN